MHPVSQIKYNLEFLTVDRYWEILLTWMSTRNRPKAAILFGRTVYILLKFCESNPFMLYQIWNAMWNGWWAKNIMHVVPASIMFRIPLIFMPAILNLSGLKFFFFSWFRVHGPPPHGIPVRQFLHGNIPHQWLLCAFSTASSHERNTISWI